MTVHEGKWKWLVMYMIDVVVYEGVGRSKETLLAGYIGCSYGIHP